MKRFFDTSALIPVFLENHEHHQRSFDAFVSTQRDEGFCAAHSLAEVFATVTRLPGRHRLGPEQALLFLESIRERLRLVGLTGDEYHAAIKEAADGGIIGGTVYDALIARCASKARADTIFTWKIKHFERLGPEIARRLRQP